MSQKGRTTTLEERVTIAERMRAGQKSREIAEELGRPMATVRKWRKRYRREGRTGLASRMGRPANGALASASAEMKDGLLELREKQPGWGPQTLRLEITKDALCWPKDSESGANCGISERTGQGSQV